jgi:hypothetical protein
MHNEYDVLYKLLRERIVEAAAYPVNKSEFWLNVLDTCYGERKPFPYAIAIIFGDPFAPPSPIEGLNERLKKYLPRRGE